MLDNKSKQDLELATAYICAAAVIAAGAAACLLRGFFFTGELYPFLTVWFVMCGAMISLNLFAAHRVGSRRSTDKVRGATLIVLSGPVVILVLYVIHWLRGPLSPQGTLNEILRWGLYGSFALIAYISAGTKGAARLLAAGWSGIGLSLCLSALLSVCGGLNLPYAIAYSNAPGVSVTGARLAGLLQYPNTFGAVMAVFLLERLFAVAGGYAVAGAGSEQRRAGNTGGEPGVAGSAGAALLRLLPLFPYAAALLLSESRGAWLAAACACAAALALKRQLIAPLLVAGAAPVAAAALLYRQWAAAGLAVEPLPGLLTLAGLWAGAVLAGLWLRRCRCSAARGTRAAALALAAAGWTAAGTAVLLYMRARITGPSSTVSARGLFYRDAWKLAAEAPWLGRGGETWRSMYLSAQSRPYVGSQVHNGYLDILLNLGWVGLAAVLFMLLAAGRLLAVTPHLLAPFLVIVLHSAADFDWSYGLVWLLLFWLPALAAASRDGITPLARSSLHSFPGVYAARLLILTICGLALILCVISYRADRGAALYRAAVYAPVPIEKANLLKQSLAWNPFSIQTAIELSRMVSREQRESILRTALRNSPQNAALNWEMARVHMQGDQPGAALYWIRRGLWTDAYNYAKWTGAVEGLSALGQRRLAAGEQDDAERSAAAGLEVLRQYRLLAVQSGKEGEQHNDRRFRMTEQAEAAGRRLEWLTKGQ